MSERGFAAQLTEDLSPQDLRHVLSVFETDVLRLRAALGAAALADDAAGFRRAAHGLAGAAGAVGAAALEGACRRAMGGAAPIGDAMAEIDALAGAVMGDIAACVTRLDATP